jgi:hypothetical protein
MAKLTIVSGDVTHLNAFSQTTGQIQNGRGMIATSHHNYFRIGNTQIVYKRALPINEGDKFTVAGELLRNGQFGALALRNEVTGLIEAGNPTLTWLVGAGFVLVGLPLLFVFLIGIVPLLIGIACFVSASKTGAAKKLLAQTPRATA